MSSAGVLALHQLAPWSDHYHWHCRPECGAEGPWGVPGQEFAAHQLDELRKARYAVVELPEPDVVGAKCQWSTTSNWSARVFADDRHRVHVWDEANPWNRLPEPVAPAEARTLAAALLAAADAAEAR